MSLFANNIRDRIHDLAGHSPAFMCSGHYQGRWDLGYLFGLASRICSGGEDLFWFTVSEPIKRMTSVFVDDQKAFIESAFGGYKYPFPDYDFVPSVLASLLNNDKSAAYDRRLLTVFGHPNAEVLASVYDRYSYEEGWNAVNAITEIVDNRFQFRGGLGSEVIFWLITYRADRADVVDDHILEALKG